MTRNPNLNCPMLLGVGGANGNLRIFQVAQHDIVTRGKRDGGQGGIQPHGGVVGKGDFCGLSPEQPSGFLSGLNARFAERLIIGWVAHLSRPLTEQSGCALDGLSCGPRRQPNPGSVQINLLRCSRKIRAYRVYVKHTPSQSTSAVKLRPPSVGSAHLSTKTARSLTLMIHYALFTGRGNGTQQAVNGDPKLALILFEPRLYVSTWSARPGSLPEGVELNFQALGE